LRTSRVVSVLLIAALVLGSVSVAMAAEKYHGTLRTCNLGEPKTLNPCWSMDSGGFWSCGNIFSRLVAMDVGCEPYPDLAESWDISPDYKTFTFKLRENALWHDGKPVTSADVKYTYETMIEKGYPGKTYLKLVDEITTPDEHTVVIKLTEPAVAFVPMLALAGNWYMHILPKHVYEGEDWQTGPHADNPVGSGPFKLESWTRGSHITLVANEDYYLGAPYLDKLVVRFIPDVQVAIQAFKAGELDYLPYDYMPPYAELPQWETDSTVRIVKGLWIYGENLTFNLARKPFSDIRVRRAIAMGIDRDAINKIAFDDYWVTTMNAGIPGVPQYVNPDAEYPAYDLAAAKQLLDDAGYPVKSSGYRFETTIMDPPYEYDHLLTEALIGQLTELGIKVTWNKYDWGTWFDKLSSCDFDMTVDYMRYAPDPQNYYDHFHSEGGRQFKNYSNPEVDELLELASKETDPEVRKQYYYEVQEHIVEDLPCIDLFNEVQIEFMRSNWFGNVYEPENFNKSMSWMGFYAFYSSTPPGGEDTGGSFYTSPWFIGIAALVVVVVIWYLLSRSRRSQSA